MEANIGYNDQKDEILKGHLLQVADAHVLETSLRVLNHKSHVQKTFWWQPKLRPPSTCRAMYIRSHSRRSRASTYRKSSCLRGNEYSVDLSLRVHNIDQILHGRPLRPAPAWDLMVGVILRNQPRLWPCMVLDPKNMINIIALRNRFRMFISRLLKVAGQRS